MQRRTVFEDFSLLPLGLYLPEVVKLMVMVTDSSTLLFATSVKFLRQKIENFTYSIWFFLDEFPRSFDGPFFLGFIFTTISSLVFFFQAFAPSVLFLLDFPVVAWSRSSGDSVHKV